MAAEPEPLAAVKADPAIAITDDSAAIVLAPVEGETGDGLVFIPGAKVDPWAYAAKLSGIVESGTTVVITKPWLNLAFFDLRPLDAFTSLAPDVDTWAVGGHSLGGVPACQLTESAQALILFASYCANDLSTSGLPVLSLAGELDGLSTPEKIADARPLLPAGADMVEIAGAAHSSFGDYGPQRRHTDHLGCRHDRDPHLRGRPYLADAGRGQLTPPRTGSHFVDGSYGDCG